MLYKTGTIRKRQIQMHVSYFLDKHLINSIVINYSKRYCRNLILYFHRINYKKEELIHIKIINKTNLKKVVNKKNCISKSRQDYQ